MSSRYILPFADVGSGIKPSSGSKLFFFEPDGVTPKDTFSDQLTTPTPNTNPVIANSNGVFGDIFITGEYKNTLKDKDDVQIFGGVVIKEVIDSDFLDKLNPATLAIAIADTSLEDGDVLHIKERSSGNGGGSIWDVVLTTSVTPNTFNIVVSAGNALLSLVLRIEGDINVNTFGVTPNGVSSTAAFQAVLDTVLPGQGIFFPNQNLASFYLIGAVSMTGKSTIRFHGSLPQINTTGQWTFESCTFLHFDGLKLEESGLARARTGLSIKVASAGSKITDCVMGGHDIAIDIDNSWQIKITGCDFSGNRQTIRTGVVGGSADHCQISENIFGTHFGSAIKIGMNQANISNNSFETTFNNTLPDIDTDASNSQNLTIEGNTFFDSSGVLTRGETIISSNSFEQCDHSASGILIDCVGSRTVVSGNRIKQLLATDNITGVKMAGEGVVTGNWISRALTGVEIATTGTVVVTGNHINSQTSSATRGIILTSGSASPVISGNTMSVLGSFGIEEVGTPTNGMYTGNTFNVVNGGGDPVSVKSSSATSSRIDIAFAGVPTLNAGVGSTFRRTDGGAGTSFYVREAVGWVAK